MRSLRIIMCVRVRVGIRVREGGKRRRKEKEERTIAFFDLLRTIESKIRKLDGIGVQLLFEREDSSFEDDLFIYFSIKQGIMETKIFILIEKKYR